MINICQCYEVLSNDDERSMARGVNSALGLGCQHHVYDTAGDMPYNKVGNFYTGPIASSQSSIESLNTFLCGPLRTPLDALYSSCLVSISQILIFRDLDVYPWCLLRAN